MKIEPGKVTPTASTDSRASIERATQAFINAGKPSQEAPPVSNPTAISPEEMSAIPKTSDGEAPQTDTVETPESQVASEAPKATKEEPLSSQYAQLARKEKAVRARALEIKAKEAELAAREAALKPASEPPKAQEPSLKDLAQKDPLRALQELGLSYEQITEVLLNQNPQEQALRGEVRTEVEALKAEIRALREESKQTRQQDQEQAYKNAVAQIKTDVSSMVKTSDDYEMIRETGSIDDVVELIEVTFKEEGRVMPIDEAAQLVEEHLLEEATRLTRLKKIQSKLASLKSETTTQTKPQIPQQQQQNSNQVKTLTNSMSTNKPMSAKERAILAFEGKLTKTGS